MSSLKSKRRIVTFTVEVYNDMNEGYNLKNNKYQSE